MAVSRRALPPSMGTRTSASSARRKPHMRTTDASLRRRAERERCCQQQSWRGSENAGQEARVADTRSGREGGRSGRSARAVGCNAPNAVCVSRHVPGLRACLSNRVFGGQEVGARGPGAVGDPGVADRGAGLPPLSSGDDGDACCCTSAAGACIRGRDCGWGGLWTEKEKKRIQWPTLICGTMGYVYVWQQRHTRQVV